MKTSAPTAKEALAATMDAVRGAGKLPTQDDGINWQEKDLHGGGDIQKAVGSYLEKSLGLITKTVGDQIMKVQGSVDTVGNILNDVARRQTDVEKRLNTVEKVGGVSHSGPRGATEGSSAGAAPGTMWGGIFNQATNQATNKF